LSFGDIQDQSNINGFPTPTEQKITHVFSQHEQPPELDVARNEFGEDVPIAQELLNLYHDTSNQQQAFPNFFEHIMVSETDFLGVEYPQPPPDFTKWMPEIDWLDNVDICTSHRRNIRDTSSRPGQSERVGRPTSGHEINDRRRQ
jgi:hypothetical protein